MLSWSGWRLHRVVLLTLAWGFGTLASGEAENNAGNAFLACWKMAVVVHTGEAPSAKLKKVRPPIVPDEMLRIEIPTHFSFFPMPSTYTTRLWFDGRTWALNHHCLYADQTGETLEDVLEYPPYLARCCVNRRERQHA